MFLFGFPYGGVGIVVWVEPSGGVLMVFFGWVLLSSSCSSLW